VLGELEPCLIGIEASTGAFYWQRQFEKLGHTVRIMAPQYVKPFVRRQKNDSDDAEAICTAVQQRNMRFVPKKKTLEQQDIQALHRARLRLVNHRTAYLSARHQPLYLPHSKNNVSGFVGATLKLEAFLPSRKPKRSVPPKAVCCGSVYWLADNRRLDGAISYLLGGAT
jgi:hypothetical protein